MSARARLGALASGQAAAAAVVGQLRVLEAEKVELKTPEMNYSATQRLFLDDGGCTTFSITSS